MTFVKSIFGNYPPPRVDGQPFTQARLDESETQHGVYTPRQTFVLNPVDSDPLNPQARDFTITTAEFDDSWIRVVWIDASGNLSMNEPVYTRAAPTTLATVDDVKRVMRNSNINEEDVGWLLQVIESYLTPKLPPYSAGAGTHVEYNVRSDDVVYLPIENTSVSQVRAFYLPESAATIFYAGKDYTLSSAGVRLAGHGTGWDPRYGPGYPSNTVWSRVEIDWTNPFPVPPAIREAVAMAAAQAYVVNPTLVKGMRSERIGSYSYTLSDKDVEGMLGSRASALLKPFMKKRRVFVT